METKVCPRCKIEKSLVEFNRHAAKAFGYQTYCRVCQTEKRKQFFARNPGKQKEYDQHKRAAHQKELNIACKKRYEKNKERYRITQKKYYETHKKEINKQKQKYQEKHKEKFRLYHQQYQKTHPETFHAIAYRRKARKLGATGTATTVQIQARIEIFGHKCWICGAPYEQVDHVIPLVGGGTNWPANLRPICKHCNVSKRDKPYKQFLAEHPDLVKPKEPIILPGCLKSQNNVSGVA